MLWIKLPDSSGHRNWSPPKIWKKVIHPLINNETRKKTSPTPKPTRAAIPTIILPPIPTAKKEKKVYPRSI
jgi:hypothetical protein